jgi:hypothetical protein
MAEELIADEISGRNNAFHFFLYRIPVAAWFLSNNSRTSEKVDFWNL